MIKNIHTTADLLTAAPLTTDNWDDFKLLLGEKGGCGGCWCMTPRLPTSIYKASKGEGNKQLIHDLVNMNEHLGIIAYYDNNPAGWCSVSPKVRLLAMKNSTLLKLTAVENTWAIVCLFVGKTFRRKGLSIFLIKKATEYAFQNGAGCVEAFPVTSKQEKVPDVFAWQGFEKSYIKAGYQKKPGMSRPVLFINNPC